MYRQLLIAGLVAGASLTAGGIAAVWTMKKSPAELYSDLGHKLKPIVRSIQTASWNEHGRAEPAARVVASAGSRHGAVAEPSAPAQVTVLATAAGSAAASGWPAATKGAAHCALTDSCTPALAIGNSERHVAGAALPAAAGLSLPLATGRAPVPAVTAAPAALTAPAPSVTMLLADTTPIDATIIDAIEFSHPHGPRDAIGQAQEVPGSLAPAAAPASPAGILAPPVPQLFSNPDAVPEPSATQPVFELAKGPAVVKELVNPDGEGTSAPLGELPVTAAADSAVGEPSTNVLLLAAMLCAAVLVRRRVP